MLCAWDVVGLIHFYIIRFVGMFVGFVLIYICICIYIYMTRLLSNLLRIFAWDGPPSVGAMIRNMRSSGDFAMKHRGKG